jgi:hypothetical protein
MRLKDVESSRQNFRELPKNVSSEIEPKNVSTPLPRTLSERGVTRFPWLRGPRTALCAVALAALLLLLLRLRMPAGATHTLEPLMWLIAGSNGRKGEA